MFCFVKGGTKCYSEWRLITFSLNKKPDHISFFPGKRGNVNLFTTFSNKASPLYVQMTSPFKFYLNLNTFFFFVHKAPASLPWLKGIYAGVQTALPNSRRILWSQKRNCTAWRKKVSLFPPTSHKYSVCQGVINWFSDLTKMK